VTKSENQLIRECLGGHIENSSEGISLKNRVSYRVQEMGLSESYTTVNEEWVVALTRLLSYSHCSSVAELIAVTNHEILEGVAGINVVKNLTFNGGMGWNSAWLSDLLLLLARLLYGSRANSLNDKRCSGTTEAR
jgi:hypothetical protein